MNDQDKSDLKFSDEPLFVLRYRRLHVLLRTAVFSFGFILFAGFAVFPSGSAFGFLFKPVLGLLALLSIRSVVELLSFKEIRLYMDRMVQVRKWGETVVHLANASLTTSSSRGLRTKSIFDQDMEIYRGWLPRLLLFWRIIAYEETLADPKDVERFNCLLAYVSGRRLQELQGNLESLTKKGADQHLVINDTPAGPLLRSDDREQTAFDHTADRAWLVVIAPLAVPIFVLVLLWIWWSLW